MKQCPICKKDLKEKEIGVYQCSCGYTEIEISNVKETELKARKNLDKYEKWKNSVEDACEEANITFEQAIKFMDALRINKINDKL